MAESLCRFRGSKIVHRTLISGKPGESVHRYTCCALGGLLELLSEREVETQGLKQCKRGCFKERSDG